MKRLISYLSLSILAVILITACVIQQNPVSGSKRAFAYSWEQEKQIGRDVDVEVVEQFGLYTDEEVAEYVARIGEEVLAVSHMRREETDRQFRETEFTFRVLDSPVINAFALPGGYIYMTRGLMAHLNNEAQFAVVMGHEIGHVAARHASQRALRQTIGQVAVLGGAIIGQEVLGLPGQAIMDLSGTAAQLLFLSYSRDAERESDKLGVEYAAMRNYVAAEGSAFFTSLKRISEQSGQSIPNFLSTHPDPGEREQTIPKLAQEWRERGYEQTELKLEEYMQVIDGMIYGENPRNGFEREGVFYHPDLEFRFNVPDGWNLFNQPTQVALVSSEQDAVSIFSIDSEAGTARESVRNITNRDEIELIDEESAMSSDRWEAYRATANATTQDGTPLRLIIYAVEYDNRVYQFLSYTVRGQFQQFESNFNNINRSFDELKDPEILAIQPVKIEVMRADRSGSFSSFLPEPLPMDIQPMDMAILNQVDLDTQIDRGQWIKLPVQN